jgi:hypothetical protein
MDQRFAQKISPEDNPLVFSENLKYIMNGGIFSSIPRMDLSTGI